MPKGLNNETDPILQSVIRIELLAFFQANPHTRDTVDGLALRLHRPRHQVESALNCLTAIGILEISGTKELSIYRLRNGNLISDYFKD
ncbi:hypothetical protein [Desulfallas thermosapovorans]|uniref:Uncharacterized protein n=1 Tax=Desulfallas thermosapovorans DSM 6562 TaxID=1121431 RepID=A0A5S4ZX71_9FIRM|nr:hypothetical protein [Desulfallas thermosapovorans]TYO97419.1 hypothetical protein LX24_00614 [Desulfallas thermosapovorans DSM 6562]